MPKRETVKVKCNGCGLEGEITVRRMEEVSCPECGALYIAWVPPDTGKMELTCVVCPVFEDSPNAHGDGSAVADTVRRDVGQSESEGG